MSNLANRVAARYLQAQGMGEAPQEQTAMPMSKPGKQMILDTLEAMEKAVEAGHDSEFRRGLEALNKNYK